MIGRSGAQGLSILPCWALERAVLALYTPDSTIGASPCCPSGSARITSKPASYGARCVAGVREEEMPQVQGSL
jgi:hypothetical protein